MGQDERNVCEIKVRGREEEDEGNEETRTNEGKVWEFELKLELETEKCEDWSDRSPDALKRCQCLLRNECRTLCFLSRAY